MICSNCKNEISDEAVFCPKCGAPLRVLNNDEVMVKKRNFPFLKQKRNIIIIAIIICILMLGIIVFNQKNVKYDIAERLYQSENYELSEKLYKSLGNYKDSSDKLEDSKLGASYNDGISFMKSKKYEKAISSFEDSNHFKDSDDKIKESYYLWGNQLSEKKKVIKAAKAYRKAGGYKDSEEKIVSLAENKISNDDYKTAAKILRYSADEEKESYGKGYIDFLNKEYESAYNLLSNAGEIYNAKEIYNEAGLMYAQICMSEGSLDVASEVLGTIDEATEYDGVAASSLQEKLNMYADFVALCGTWSLSSGHAEVTQYGDYLSYSWDRDLDPDENELTVKCIINDDGTVTVNTEGSIFVFTNFSTIQAGLDYLDYGLNTSQTVASMGVINIDEFTQLELSGSGINVTYDCTETNKDVYFTYSYITYGTFGTKVTL